MSMQDAFADIEAADAALSEIDRLRAEVEELHAANKAAVATAVIAELDRMDLAARRAQDKTRAADRARSDAYRKAFEALAEVAKAVHAILPDDALKDVDGAPIVACGRTRPQLLRALAELAVMP